MADLKSGELIDMLGSTPFAEDVEIQCLSYALKKMTGVILGCADGTMVRGGLDHVKENILDVLAIEDDAQYYQQDMAEDVKREVIRHALQWKEKAGTPGAVRGVVGDVYGGGSVEEWFSYGGEPGHFKISVASEDMHIVIPESFVRLVNRMKRLSAVMDGMDFTWSTYEEIFTGTAQYQIFRNADMVIRTE